VKVISTRGGELISSHALHSKHSGTVRQPFDLVITV
jgi:hypothetical protein